MTSHTFTLDGDPIIVEVPTVAVNVAVSGLPGPPGPPGPESAMAGFWLWDTDATGADPAAGHAKANTPDAADATTIRLSLTQSNGAPASWLSAPRPGDSLTIRPNTDELGSSGITWTVTDFADVDAVATIWVADGRYVDAGLEWDDAECVVALSVVAPPGDVVSPCVMLTKSAVQSIAASTATAVTFNGETFDTSGFHDNATNPSRITIPAGMDGVYLFGGTVEINALADTRATFATLYKNGAAVSPAMRARGAASASYPIGSGISQILPLVAGDYVELFAHHSDIVNRDVRASADGTGFWAVRLGRVP